MGGLYAAGEVAGTLGVHRPGGSALNSTQVGSLRAAQHIAFTSQEHIPDDKGWEISAQDLAEQEAQKLLSYIGTSQSVTALRHELQTNMSRVAAHVRDMAGMQHLEQRLAALMQAFDEVARVSDVRHLSSILKLRDAMITQRAVLDAMHVSALTFGSRGGALVIDENGKRLSPRINGSNVQIVTTFGPEGPHSCAEAVEPIPRTDTWFENVWAEHRRERSLTAHS